MKTKFLSTLLVAGTLAAGLATGLPANAQTLEKVTIGEVAPIALFWPGAVARDLKFYEKEGLEADNIFVGSSPGIVQQVIGGSLDFGFTTAEATIRAIDKGADIAIIGETVIKWPYSIIVQSDINSPNDLKGKKVMLPSPTQSVTVMWHSWLEKNGYDYKAMDEVFDPATPTRYAALINGAVVATTVTQPFDFKAISQGYKKLIDFATLPDQDFAFVVIIANRKLLNERPETARKFLRAVSNSVDWLYDPANRDAAIDNLVKLSKTDVATITQTYDYYFNEVKTPFSKGAAIVMPGEKKLIDLLVENGAIKDADPAKYTDASYLPK